MITRQDNERATRLGRCSGGAVVVAILKTTHVSIKYININSGHKITWKGRLTDWLVGQRDVEGTTTDETNKLRGMHRMNHRGVIVKKKFDTNLISSSHH